MSCFEEHVKSDRRRMIILLTLQIIALETVHYIAKSGWQVLNVCKILTSFNKKNISYVEYIRIYTNYYVDSARTEAPEVTVVRSLD